MPQLPNGDIIPSFLQIEHTDRYYDGHAFDNLRLRIGEVQDIVYPQDDASKTKRFVEYRVLVQQRSNDTGNGKIYESCLLINSLEGKADRSFHTLRFDKSQNKDKAGLGLGSKVLILCANGETNNAWIIGGQRDPTDDDLKAKDLGHHFYWNFNGISAYIDKDGEFVATYNGKTKIDGTVDDNVDSKVLGSTIKMAKDGAVQIADKDGKNAVTVDHANSKVLISRDKGFEIGKATDKMMLGSSFRKSQKQLNTMMQAQLNKLQGLLVTAGTAITAAAAIPAVIGVAPSGFAPAGAALTQAAQTAGQLAQAIQQFEQDAGSSTDFLSDIDKLG